MNSRSTQFIKPNIDHLDTSTQRLKRNLLVSSIITIALSLQKVTMAKDVKFAGYNFEGLSVETLFYSLLFITLYLFLDFYLSIMSHLRENHIRLTGLNTPKPTAGSSMGGHEYDSVTTEERQSSLYSWWSGQIGLVTELEQNVKKLILEAEANEIKLQLATINSSLNKLKKKRNLIQSALIRFERAFWRHIRMQYFRFIIFEFYVPAFLAGVAIVACCCKIADL